MVVINRLILLAVWEILSHNFPSVKGESFWSLTIDDDNKTITGGGTHIVLWIYGGTIIIEDIEGDLKFWGTTTSLIYHWSLLKELSDENELVAYQSPFFHILADCEVNFTGMVFV